MWYFILVEKLLQRRVCFGRKSINTCDVLSKWHEMHCSVSLYFSNLISTLPFCILIFFPRFSVVSSQISGSLIIILKSSLIVSVIWSTYGSHLEHVEMTLQLLRQHELYAKMS